MQQLAETALDDQPGAVVAIDPRSGHVLAMASWPRIDYNTIVDGVTQEEYETYFFDERQPFINRAVEQVYAPGSTFKVVTLAAALEGGGYEITDRISCPALWMEVGDEPLHNWKDVDQGRITLSQALAESCNTVFYEVGLTLDRIDEHSPAFGRFAGFGFGQPTGILGLSEEGGVNPGPSPGRLKQINEAWYTGDTLNMSIGQGFVAVTVLQMANAYAALATNGVVGSADHRAVDRTCRFAASSDRATLDQRPAGVGRDAGSVAGGAAHDGLAAVRHGLRRLQPQRPAGTAGKSGTAEDQVIDPETLAALNEEAAAQQSQEEEIEAELASDQQASEEDEQEEEEDRIGPYTTHAWFAAWANYDEPRLVVTVVLDDGESGSDDAGPIARRVLEGAMLNDWVP